MKYFRDTMGNFHIKSTLPKNTFMIMLLNHDVNLYHKWFLNTYYVGFCGHTFESYTNQEKDTLLTIKNKALASVGQL